MENDLDVYERSLLCDLRSDYQGEPLEVFPEVREEAAALISKGYIFLVSGTESNPVTVQPKEIKNKFNFTGKKIADFRQVSDRSIYIEFDDGTEVTIESNFAYDGDDGYTETSYLEIKVD